MWGTLEQKTHFLSYSWHPWWTSTANYIFFLKAWCAVKSVNKINLLKISSLLHLGKQFCMFSVEDKQRFLSSARIKQNFILRFFLSLWKCSFIFKPVMRQKNTVKRCSLFPPIKKTYSVSYTHGKKTSWTMFYELVT